MLRILVTDDHSMLMSEADAFIFVQRILEEELRSSFYIDNLISSYIVFNTISDKEV